MPLFIYVMRELYIASITQIDELGGASSTVTTSTIVCDRCGRQTPKDELIHQSGFYVCEDCLDEED